MADEYLVSYGRSGEFGRFRPVADTRYQRSDRVVVRSQQGLEQGVVLCMATEGHGRFLSRTAVGELIRPMTARDEEAASRAAEKEHQLFNEARSLVAGLVLPIEVLDAEVLLDGEQVILHCLGSGDYDQRPFVSSLSRRFDVHLSLHNLAVPTSEEADGCGKPNCGKTAGGGCGTCGTGGGCSTCGKGVGKEEVAAYLAAYHPPTPDHVRTSLL